MDLGDIIQRKEGTIVDVRTPAEYSGGHAAGSINIPLQEIGHRLEELKSLNKPLVLCCASGGRSRQATSYLQRNEIECVDAGSWIDVHYFQEQQVKS
jgi:rhodanese-related sulfurtransferase